MRCSPKRRPAPQPGSRLHFSATAYCKGETTASGVTVRTGIAAADPTLLPVGTVVRLDMPDARYDGIWTIMDTGPAVQGRIVDLYLWSCHDALRFGRRPIELTVLRLGWNPQNSEPGRAETLYRQREVERARLPLLTKPVDPTSHRRHLTPPVVPAVATQPPPRSLRRAVRDPRDCSDRAGDRSRAAPAAPGDARLRAARPCGTRARDPSPESSTADARSRSSSGRASALRARPESAASVSVSMLDVASSSSSTGGSKASARANDNSCFCPTDSVAPRSATGASSPPSASTNESAWTARSARPHLRRRPWRRCPGGCWRRPFRRTGARPGERARSNAPQIGQRPARGRRCRSR